MGCRLSVNGDDVFESYSQQVSRIIQNACSEIKRVIAPHYVGDCLH
jgi:hypothetical protein